MTYKNAHKVNVGDTIKSKDNVVFKVNEIKRKANAANTEQYIVFCGITSEGIKVNYNHKQIELVVKSLESECDKDANVAD